MRTERTSFSDPPQKVKGRILIVDDEVPICLLLSQMLAYFGYDVSIANNGNDGLRRAVSGNYDIVITDLKMPGLDGMELAFRVKALFPERPVILMTGSDREAFVGRAPTSPFDHTLFKPFLLDDLRNALRSLSP